MSVRGWGVCISVEKSELLADERCREDLVQTDRQDLPAERRNLFDRLPEASKGAEFSDFSVGHLPVVDLPVFFDRLLEPGPPLPHRTRRRGCRPGAARANSPGPASAHRSSPRPPAHWNRFRRLSENRRNPCHTLRGDCS